MDNSFSRRALLKAGLASSLGGVALGSSSINAAGGGGESATDDHVLVVVELSGGNDGLNTLVPYGDDAYYRQRPTIGIKPHKLLKVDDHFGFNAGAQGLHRLWESGDLAAVHGCGYERPSYSHFTSMGYWQTAAPHSGQPYGWVGRLADELAPAAPANFLVNVGAGQSLAVKARQHVPVVFDDPSSFARNALAPQRSVFDAWFKDSPENRSLSEMNSSRAFLRDVARSAKNSSAEIRRAWDNYKSPIDYGIAPLDLPKVAACIEHELPARLYYVAFRNNSFDTHVQQGPLHQRLLSYAADAIHGFVRDMQRLGKGKKVSLLVFSEFGRRVGENANGGTDHGSANLMFVAGEPVNGGHVGEWPDLLDLNAEDNLKHTTDFRRVYASVMDQWLQPNISRRVLGASYAGLPLFTA